MTFSGISALDAVDIEIPSGQILGLIGPNGAGKTTLVNVLAGLQRATSGTVIIGDQDATRRSPRERARFGLGRTFQSSRLFPNLSVFENVLAAASTARAGSAEDRTWDLLSRFGLEHRAAYAAGSLPHGEARLVGLARALATLPRWLLLDEPAAGLNEVETETLREVLAVLPADFEVGILVIEHDMGLIMRLCDRVQVLDHGRTIALGTPDEVQEDPAVMTAYLGTVSN